MWVSNDVALAEKKIGHFIIKIKSISYQNPVLFLLPHLKSHLIRSEKRGFISIAQIY